jgi:hypothetical protein
VRALLLAQLDVLFKTHLQLAMGWGPRRYQFAPTNPPEFRNLLAGQGSQVP